MTSTFLTIDSASGTAIASVSAPALSQPAGAVGLIAVLLGGATVGLFAVRAGWRCFGVVLPRSAVAAVCAVVGAAVVVRLGPSAVLAPLLAFAWVGVAVAGIDLRTHLIPTRLLRAGMAVALVLLCLAALLSGDLVAGAQLLGAGLLGGVGAGLAMHVLWLVARGGLGYGDVRLGGYLGVHLGLGGAKLVFLGLLAGFAFAAAVGTFAVLVLRRGTDHRFALGPSLVAGALVAVLWGAP